MLTVCRNNPRLLCHPSLYRSSCQDLDGRTATLSLGRAITIHLPAQLSTLTVCTAMEATAMASVAYLQ